jgi:glycerol 2-dehydrogenase (NADP+)
MADTKFPLNTGASIPALGLGTWQSDPGEVTKAVSYALSVGYKHIDAAYCYGNEDEVGAGLKEAFANGVKREDIFVTTKLWCTYQSRVELNLDMSLKSLGLDYVDLYLMHWPVAMNPNGKFSSPLSSRYHCLFSTADANIANNRQPREIPETPRRIPRLSQRLDTHPNMEANGEAVGYRKSQGYRCR